MKRYGSVVELKKDCIEKYCDLHRNPWPHVLDMIERCNIRNYSIFMRRFPDGRYYLFSYFEYIGNDYEADMKKMADDEIIQKWWDECMPCHTPFADRDVGEWWASMEEVFHC